MTHTINLQGLVYETDPVNTGLLQRNGTALLTGSDHIHTFSITATCSLNNETLFGRTIQKKIWHYSIDAMCNPANTAHLHDCCAEARQQLSEELIDQHLLNGSRIMGISWAF